MPGHREAGCGARQSVCRHARRHLEQRAGRPAGIDDSRARRLSPHRDRLAGQRAPPADARAAARPPAPRHHHAARPADRLVPAASPRAGERDPHARSPVRRRRIAGAARSVGPVPADRRCAGPGRAGARRVGRRPPAGGVVAPEGPGCLDRSAESAGRSSARAAVPDPRSGGRAAARGARLAAEDGDPRPLLRAALRGGLHGRRRSGRGREGRELRQDLERRESLRHPAGRRSAVVPVPPAVPGTARRRTESVGRCRAADGPSRPRERVVRGPGSAGRSDEACAGGRRPGTGGASRRALRGRDGQRGAGPRARAMALAVAARSRARARGPAAGRGVETVPPHGDGLAARNGGSARRTGECRARRQSLRARRRRVPRLVRPARERRRPGARVQRESAGARARRRRTAFPARSRSWCSDWRARCTASGSGSAGR